MSTISIYRASAGSGKTFQLTGEYLRLVFKNPASYRNILAVTFTNKATDEMKGRIIKELYKLSCGTESNYVEMLRNELKLDDKQIIYRAKLILKKILHDYSRFSVSTIDSFFQQVLRSFARELNLRFGFDIELSSGGILGKAVDNLLDSPDANPDLDKWLSDFTFSKIEGGSSWNVRNEIVKLGKQIFNEEFKSFSPEYTRKLSDRKYLKNYSDELNEIIALFDTELKSMGKNAVDLIEHFGLTVESFAGGSRSFATFFIKIQKQKPDYYEYTKTVKNVLEDPSAWHKKNDPYQKEIETARDNGVYAALYDVVQYIDTNLPGYLTAKKIQGEIYTLGILSDISREIRKILNEENIFLLADAAELIRGVIDSNDAPFIYEKTGHVYRYFMIDEFQDTSGFQWENFKPLLINSLSEGNPDLVVGDIKQSIYRWRSSDWTLLGGRMQRDLSGFDIDEKILRYNWRSLPEVIGFNNSMFEGLPVFLQDIFNKECGTGFSYLHALITGAYSDSEQLIPEKTPDGGYVNVSFLKDQEWKEKALEKMTAVIAEGIGRGYSPGSFVVLVRTKKDAKAVTDYLINYKSENPGFKGDVLSDEALYISSSEAVKIIVLALKYLSAPEDGLTAASLVYNHLVYTGNYDESLLHKVFSEKDVLSLLPESFKEIKAEKAWLSFHDLVEKIINVLDLAIMEKEIPYLLSFKNMVYDFSKNHAAGIIPFLEWWEEEGVGKAVSPSEGQDAIRVLTIHKAKGLEYDNVLIPFCGWSMDNSEMRDFFWCKPKVKPFDGLEKIPMKFSSGLMDTHFREDYLREKIMSYIDSINLLYVAFTRARHNLYVIAPGDIPDTGNISNIGQLLYTYMNNQESPLYTDFDYSSCWNQELMRFESGIPAIPEEKSESRQITLQAGFVPFNTSESRVIIKRSGDNYFEGKQKENINKGKILHEILASVRYAGDVEKALQNAVFSGLIRVENLEDVKKDIEKIISDDPTASWFKPSWQVKNETSVLLTTGEVKRPDRIIYNENETIIIDYKVTDKESQSYITQVKEYMGYFRQMGFPGISGYLLYIPSLKTVKIDF
ncbi:MAG: hypothetical protein A2W91_19885 [Bacteroidetes bacterium GWF2_38_335]|nr:MAG: hypothetical protein A2W91_19885 [Bacteroidetes bacterium GWF2_38_335]OFY82017.1 MAG: hypothetical protein A2281_10035 [Bacteroidetes bacterium RIFOXYA12_FULL_38_20]HBS86480.1 hypothetical protein [Bacteroidales bacterium]